MKRIAPFVFIAFAAIGLLGFPSTAFSQALPPCLEDQNVVWDNCFGTYTWADGNKYVGEWEDNSFNGQGTYTWADGTKYVGKWQDGRRNGQGTLTYANGNKYVGEYREDLKNGVGTLVSPNGTVIHGGLWLNGEPVVKR
jgi:hypothetical protein